MAEMEPKKGQSENGILEDVGALKELTGLLTKEETSCNENQDDVGSWITVIGKALLAIFK